MPRKAASQRPRAGKPRDGQPGGNADHHRPGDYPLRQPARPRAAGGITNTRKRARPAVTTKAAMTSRRVTFAALRARRRAAREYRLVVARIGCTTTNRTVAERGRLQAESDSVRGDSAQPDRVLDQLEEESALRLLPPSVHHRDALLQHDPQRETAAELKRADHGHGRTLRAEPALRTV